MSKKTEKVKTVIRKQIQSLYEVAEVAKGKKRKSQIYYAINHLNNVLNK